MLLFSFASWDVIFMITSQSQATCSIIKMMATPVTPVAVFSPEFDISGHALTQDCFTNTCWVGQITMSKHCDKRFVIWTDIHCLKAVTASGLLSYKMRLDFLFFLFFSPVFFFLSALMWSVLIRCHHCRNFIVNSVH